ncbi:unnamed protein product [Candidula unifasciata]|uniref:Serpin domain-containing protein n=1 Tax=Candidula unifasciata TaxID=100452 RepID=A0A8S3ZX53_9EUPU|nr:unnamed protein product [Candidula unifasciata]
MDSVQRSNMQKTIIILLGCCFVIAATRPDPNYLLSLSRSSPIFSEALYRQIAVRRWNVVYSPFSVQAALGMLLIGAGNGPTFEEINRVAFLNPYVPANVEFKGILLQWNNVTALEVYNSNGIFLNPHLPIERQFTEAAWFYYFAQSTNFDLAYPGGPERHINEFVERQTNHYVKNLLEPGTINSATAAILVNAIFFKGTWLQVFEPRHTRKSVFYSQNRGQIQLDTMHSVRYVNIKRNVLGADIIELPYKERFALYIALPQATYGVQYLEAALGFPGAINQLFEGFRTEHVSLALPKFRIESDFHLKQALEQLGIRTAFSPNADLSRISKVGGVYVSDVIHKAVIEVDETGTVAAAATAVIAVGNSYGFATPFKVDHPFIFFLRDRQTNIILFQGKFSG